MDQHLQDLDRYRVPGTSLGLVPMGHENYLAYLRFFIYYNKMSSSKNWGEFLSYSGDNLYGTIFPFLVFSTETKKQLKIYVESCTI